jgi:hypothetical protein
MASKSISLMHLSKKNQAEIEVESKHLASLAAIRRDTAYAQVKEVN